MVAEKKKKGLTPVRTPGGAVNSKATASSSSANNSGNNSSSSSSNLWETMLREAMRKNRLPDKTLLLVGPQGCGKSSLLDAFLEGSASSANPSGGAAASAAAAAAAASPEEGGAEGGGGSGGGGSNDPIGQQANARGFHPVLAYSYLDAADPDEQGPERDDSPPRVSVWCCSELEFEGLLQTVLRPEQVANTVVVVTVDLSRPWEVMESLTKWTAVVENHITGLLKQLSVGAQDDLRNAMKERWAAASPGVGGREASDSTASGRMGRTGSESPGGELGGGVLEKNLGVPIVVVGCKADSLQSETFEQQQRLHFIQQSIRRFCLKYGAALVYTSAKDNVNCSVLHRYLLGCLYPEAFPCSREGEVSDAAFIPAGWDSLRLIDGLLSPGKTPWGANPTFDEVVVAPQQVTRLGSGTDGGDPEGGGLAPGEEEAELVESEEAWLSSLGRQLAGTDAKTRWAKAGVAASKIAQASKSPSSGSAAGPDPRSFFASLLAGGSSSSTPAQQRKKS